MVARNGAPPPEGARHATQSSLSLSSKKVKGKEATDGTGASAGCMDTKPTTWVMVWAFQGFWLRVQGLGLRV